MTNKYSVYGNIRVKADLYFAPGRMVFHARSVCSRVHVTFILTRRTQGQEKLLGVRGNTIAPFVEKQFVQLGTACGTWPAPNYESKKPTHSFYLSCGTRPAAKYDQPYVVTKIKKATGGSAKLKRRAIQRAGGQRFRQNLYYTKTFLLPLCDQHTVHK